MDKTPGRERSAMTIGAKSLIQAVAIILALMIAAGVLTRVIPAGAYQRQTSEGRTLVIDGTYAATPRPAYPVWRWFTAPAEVLWSPDAAIVIVLIAFMLFVGAAFRVLEKGGILAGLLSAIAARFRARRYLLMAAMIVFLMLAPSLLGIYEELVPVVVFVVPMAVALGWDELTGLGMSLLPLAFGFAASVFNPFTVGVAQSIASLPLFSGAWFRFLFLGATFLITFLFVLRHARRVERRRGQMPGADAAAISPSLIPAERLRPALIWMSAWFASTILFIFAVTRIPSLSTYAFPVVALLFLIAGVGAGLISRMGGRAVLIAALQGAANMLPAILLVLMAMSVKIIIQSGGILDTILFHAAGLIRGANPFVAAFLMYLVTLALEFFVGSASAKAFLVMPILVPLADLVNVTRQTAVFAYDLGDGFSNMIYPTNAVLLIALGLVNVSYGKWMRWTLPLQAVIFAVSMGFMAFAVAIRFGPF